MVITIPVHIDLAEAVIDETPAEVIAALPPEVRRGIHAHDTDAATLGRILDHLRGE